MWSWRPVLQGSGHAAVGVRRNPPAFLGFSSQVNASLDAALHAWVRSPHCAFRSYDDEGKQRFGLVARTFGTDHLEFNSRVTIALREENLQPQDIRLKEPMRRDAVTTRAVAAMPGMGFAEFLEQVS